MEACSGPTCHGNALYHRALATYGIGEVLRSERVRQGLSLADVARKIKISPKFLGAIENDDLDALPGIVFARSFIRQYSNLLNLDADGLLARLPKSETSTMPLPDPDQYDRSRVAAARSGRTEWDPRWNSAIASILWLGLAAAASVGAYMYFNRAVVPVTSRVVETPKPEPQHTEAPKAAPATQPVSAPTPPSSNSPVQVTLTALEPAWVSLTADGKNAYTGVLQADETKSVEAATLIKLTAGNAGGLKVSYNGKPLDPLGPHGQVRVVKFTAEGLQFLAKTPSAPKNDPL